MRIIFIGLDIDVVIMLFKCLHLYSVHIKVSKLVVLQPATISIKHNPSNYILQIPFITIGLKNSSYLFYSIMLIVRGTSMSMWTNTRVYRITMFMYNDKLVKILSIPTAHSDLKILYSMDFISVYLSVWTARCHLWVCDMHHCMVSTHDTAGNLPVTNVWFAHFFYSL